MTQPMTPTDTVVSEATDTKHVKAMIEAVGHAGRVGVYYVTDASGDLIIHGPKAKALLTELLDCRTAMPQSGGMVDDDWISLPLAALQWLYGVGLDPSGHGFGDFPDDVARPSGAFWWRAVFRDILHASGVNTHPIFATPVRSTIADPIPEAPADEEVGRAMLEKAVRDAHKTLMNILDGDFGLWSSPAFAKAREAVYPLWKRLDETLIALRRSTETDKPGVRGALTLGLEAAAKWHDAEAERIRVLALDSDEPRRMHDAQDDHISHAAAIRALSASPLTEEQPAAKFKRGDRVQKIKGSAWRGHVVGTYSTSLTPEGYNVESENEPGSVQLYPAAALETLPRSTTGGAK